MALQQQPEQLEALGLDVLLQLEVLEAGCCAAGQERADFGELGLRGRKGVLRRGLARLPRPPCSAPPVRAA